MTRPFTQSELDRGASVPPPRNSPEPLDIAWAEINALGGVPDSEWDRGYVKAINDALAIIKRHGGRDLAKEPH